MTDEPKKWLNRSDLAARWDIPEATVKYWAATDKGPKYAKFGRHVRYRLADVEAWEEAQMGEAS